MKWKWITVWSLLFVLLFSGCSKGEEQKTNVGESDTEQITTEEDGDSENTQLEFTEVEPEVENKGEGTPAYDAVDLQQSDDYQIGDTISMGTDGQTLYELTIEEVAFTDERDVYTQDPGNVIVVTYTYKNLSDEELLIDDMRFQMMLTDESTLLDSYYLMDVQVAEPLAKGESCTAQISYAIAEKPEAVILAYHDTVHTELMPVKITVNNLQ